MTVKRLLASVLMILATASAVMAGDATHAAPSPRGLAGVGLEQADVDQALDAARDYLLGELRTKIERDRNLCSGGRDTLVCLASRCATCSR